MTLPYANPRARRAPFTLEDADRAGEEWGCNCGPAALAAVLNLSLEAVRPHMGDFERKRYTNPTLMLAALRSVGIRWRSLTCPISPDPWRREVYPKDLYCARGLCRVQWEGPWTEPGVPIRVRYRHTHWIASRYIGAGAVEIFDINAICAGGWIPEPEWRLQLVPWLLRECQPKANGKWHLTHRLEIEP